MAVTPTPPRFSSLQLGQPLLDALDDLGYETPSPIQAEAIPHMLQGLDLLGHAPTGTGKTAAFALPLLARLDMSANHVQVMTLCPTRELAIQVAEAFGRYAAKMPGFHVLPIYGGQDYTGQLRQLKRGVQVVVGTPGRVMDHMRKGTLKLGGLQALVLDEADEMLRMGFIDEVEWILEQTPPGRQMALFSATMPKEIQRIARRHLRNPQEISIKGRTATAETIRQRYWLVGGMHKLDAFTRILEVEPFDAILVFVRTRNATSELAERLEARGYSAAAMNGDMAQKDREKMVDRLKRGSLDILVATDVAARGLDVKRISHVVNYDIPNDTEAYIHRIGRTGRAGRSGEAILFVAPRERRMLRAIENATRQKIEPLELPTTDTVNNKRIADFKQKITDTLAAGELAFMQNLIENYQQEQDVPAVDIAAALAHMYSGSKSLLLSADKKHKPPRQRDDSRDERPKRRTRETSDSRRSDSRRPDSNSKPDRKTADRKPRSAKPDEDMERFRIEVGYDHDVKPGNIVGAIANEAGLDAANIGQIEIATDHSLIDLPTGMPKELFNDLKKVWVCGQQLKISRLQDGPPRGTHRRADSESAGADSKPPRAGSKHQPRSAAKSKPKSNSKPKSRPQTRADGGAASAASAAKPKRADGKPKTKPKSKSKGKSNAAGKDKGKPKFKPKSGAKSTSASQPRRKST